ncbi:MAG: pyridoxal phosphate-dependent aminotransferase [Candidatus Kapabacteria bacterium]|nr:pyridoxal phosphate-dependent aminotransferase [Candidatus Kapabacteria bacterium]
MKDFFKLQTTIKPEIIQKHVEYFDRRNIAAGNTRVMMRLVDFIERDSGEKFIRMEIGTPGLNPSQIGIDAEIAALKTNIASVYPSAEGVTETKEEIARFAKKFLNLDIAPEHCVPTVGGINGAYATFMVAGRRYKDKDTVLLIDPGFPAHRLQVKMIGLKLESLDIYEYRGNKLEAKLEEILAKGNISTLLFSNPNNPAWICLSEEEIQIIAKLCEKYNVIPIEDLAYLGMDYRVDYSHPDQPPYPPSITKYTDYFVLLLSSSKSFSYAGQRIGMMLISAKLFDSKFPDLTQYYLSEVYGPAITYGTMLLTSGGVPQSSQAALAAMLRAASDGQYQFLEETKIYAEKARIMKKIFLENGFQIVYDKDGDVPIADGFYFTVSFPGLRGDELTESLLYFGISSIPLSSTGSLRIEGIRACTSLIKMEQIPELEQRLKLFRTQMAEM